MLYSIAHKPVFYRWLYRRCGAAVLALLVGWYGWATLPHLGDFPLVSWDEGMIAAPAYKLAARGIYGNDLYAGYYGTDMYNYEYMPAYPLLLALTFKVFGVGVIQARLTAVACGLVVLLLTFGLGRMMYGTATGLLAVTLLVGVQLRVAPDASGIVLLDVARVARYEPLTLCMVLATCCCFLWAHSKLAADQALEQPSSSTAKEQFRAALQNPLRWAYPALGTPFRMHWGFTATGVLAGLATLTHPNGALVLAVVLGTLCWHYGRVVLGRAPPYLILTGWALAMLPWLAYIAQHPDDFYGQMLRQSAIGRFDLLDPSFYWNNLRREPYRYVDLLCADGHLVLLPRYGLWLMIAGVLTTNILLWRRIRRSLGLADRLLLLALPLMAVLLGSLISVKWYHYMAVLLPFVALQSAYGLVAVWRKLPGPAHPLRLLLGLLLVGALVEGGLAVARQLERARTTSSYAHLTHTLTHTIPPGSRILIYHSYWFGLAHTQTRSILLPFYLSSPYYQPGAPSMQQTLQQLSLDYLLADSHVEPEVVAPPSPGMDALVEAQRQDFMQYMRRHCAERITSVEDRDYGNITLYRCVGSS